MKLFKGYKPNWLSRFLCNHDHKTLSGKDFIFIGKCEKCGKPYRK